MCARLAGVGGARASATSRRPLRRHRRARASAEAAAVRATAMPLASPSGVATARHRRSSSVWSALLDMDVRLARPRYTRPRARPALWA